MDVQASQKEFLPWADLIRVVATFLVVPFIAFALSFLKVYGLQKIPVLNRIVP